MPKIKFGTDGWRAIIAKEFTVDNVARVTIASAQWVKENFSEPTVVVGHDCRFAGELFAETTAKVFANAGIKVYLAKGFVSTPMVSLGIVEYKASLGVIITASHNPPSYNGYKLKGYFGGPLLPQDVQKVEDTIPEKNNIQLDELSISDFEKKGLIEYIDLETIYCKHIEKHFDLDAIKNSGLRLAYDAMYGSGQNVIRRILPNAVLLHCDDNPSFKGQAPEPIHKNLLEFSNLIKNDNAIDCGLATDGDADRIGLYDSKGKFVDAHHIILLLIHYLFKYKKQEGKVCASFSTSVRIKKMCKLYGLEYQVVKIGFKHICEIMLKEDVLIGGEESGGMAIKGHIPERDGIWIGLVIWEYMAKTGKSLTELINEIYAIVGAFAFERNDLHITEKQKEKIVKNCKEGNYSSFGNYKIQRIEDLDGYKYFFNDDEWLMIRPSGTEPVLRTYAEATTQERAFDMLKVAKETLLK